MTPLQGPADAARRGPQGPTPPGSSATPPSASRSWGCASEAARRDLSYFAPPNARTPGSSLLSSAGRGGAGRDGPRTEARGRERGRGTPGAARPPSGPFSSPTVYPPGGEILLHAQQPLAQGLQHCHRRRSPLLRPRAPAASVAPWVPRRPPRAPHSHCRPRPRSAPRL